MTSAQGIDVSAYQPVLTASALEGLDFAFAKATEGTGGADPNFAGNWAAIRAAGRHRGAYHELRPGMPGAQAAHFLATVKAQGLNAGNMLAVVASDYSASGSDVKMFADAVRAATGGRNPVLVYTDLSVARSLTSCTGYDLWIAWPSDTAPPDVSPWKTWRLWQWRLTGLDRDAYNGTAAEMTAWLAAFNGSAPAPNWTEMLMQSLPELRQGATGTYVRTVQFQLGERDHKVTVDGSFGPVTSAAVKALQSAARIGVDGVVGPATWGTLFGL